jgi:hypothetical protein
MDGTHRYLVGKPEGVNAIFLDSGTHHVTAKTALSIQGIEDLTVHQVAFEWFENGAYFPLRPVLILRKVLDAVPLSRAVILAAPAFIEKIAMLLTHVPIVPPAIFDLHLMSPVLG